MLLIVLIILVVYYITCHKHKVEAMVSKPEKARAITEWFNKDGDKTYVKFRRELEDANIVEYEDALRLHKKGRLNPSNIILKL